MDYHNTNMSKECEEELENLLYNIKWLRLHNNISKKEMAKILNVGIGSINNVEKGIMPQKLGAYSLINIYRHFGVLPEDLLKCKFDQE